MDLQGTPMGSGGDGTKNTSDPRAREAINENPGPIASDSLAAESHRQGGGFSENPNSAPYAVSGEASTFNTTDTSGATRLDPSVDAASREAKAAWQESSSGPGGVAYPEGLGGQGQFSGTHSQEGYAGGPSGGLSGSSLGGSGGSSSEGQTSATGFGGGAGSTGSSGNYDTGRGAEARNVDAAPGYITSVVGDLSGGPHGKNLSEGGFDGEPSSRLPEPGSKNDPARAALGEMQRQNEAATGGEGPRQSRVDNQNPFSSVGDERA